MSSGSGPTARQEKSSAFMAALSDVPDMRHVTGDLLARAKQQVIDDLRADPYLPYILLLATVVCGF
jgi:hypothetical protein